MLVCLLVVYSQGDVFAHVSASRSTLMLRGIDYRASTDWITMEADELLSVNDIYRACDQRSMHVRGLHESMANRPCSVGVFVTRNRLVPAMCGLWNSVTQSPCQ